ncbi:hypothetical protein SRHO_G00046770 [Serrasalmus rhombeus]
MVTGVQHRNKSKTEIVTVAALEKWRSSSFLPEARRGERCHSATASLIRFPGDRRCVFSTRIPTSPAHRRHGLASRANSEAVRLLAAGGDAGRFWTSLQ